ncbi:NUDIX domain-containing protein [Haloferax mediterranei ATCC 33500]|uniref:MutT/NUDIX family protein n=1 Tax=Haloferax mediterranei (strain ATCC 33500 / DSM 1411 / JCM 8866 / NBRC 14739 / NCIMB 2177 / R-4) TaxID=523841 RepID=I3R3F6_HALMT|nr:NUDIX domain-containing protein [Haloferax mediterranei]AFK18766.1 mutT/NUDIX family protein [Haloferax mediterranei ATCC 33500]AHZ21865.1 NUDIX hydrolase [Haloferax mediterranei ATCC 33500]EMA03374.1 mutT/NUDIX family protein [Haloferax mediterranei ATCC 33500]MDX5988862.1 NUDIX domain-containing protein [Haloferax mediterranei ATCC 33500]QCQ75260.1 NUDIX domain-containing protein [Haloferax mediterranei ATCC 33500]
METTRHFTSTVYIVNDGAVALHRHERLGIRIPPGGHVDRDELPHEAGLREVREETGLNPTLVDDTDPVPAPGGEALPHPRYQMLYDINVHDDGEVGHQHIDHIYYARVDSRDIDPAPGEADLEAWDWYGPADLRESDLDEDTIQIALEAIEVVSGSN